MKAGDTILIEDTGAQVFVIELKNGDTRVWPIKSERQAARIYREQVSIHGKDAIANAYSATRNEEQVT